MFQFHNHEIEAFRYGVDEPAPWFFECEEIIPFKKHCSFKPHKKDEYERRYAGIGDWVIKTDLGFIYTVQPHLFERLFQELK